MLPSHLDIVRRDRVLALRPGHHALLLLASLASATLVVVQTHHTPAVGVTVRVVSLEFNI